jgi:hypothetical protein
MIAEDMVEKNGRGSGGYAIARVTDEEQKKGNIGGPELFFPRIGKQAPLLQCLLLAATVCIFFQTFFFSELLRGNRMWVHHLLS